MTNNVSSHISLFTPDDPHPLMIFPGGVTRFGRPHSNDICCGCPTTHKVEGHLLLVVRMCSYVLNFSLRTPVTLLYASMN